jgi:hypothetical protein
VNGALLGLGIDSVDIPRFAEVLERRPALAERLFTVGERRYAASLANPVPSLAARFAAKEAVMKALGVGLGAFGLGRRRGRPGRLRRPQSAGDRTGRVTGLAAGRRRLAPVHHPHRHRGLGRGGRHLVIPVLTPEEMAGVDRQASEPVEVLIERAGFAVARAARQMLGGGYGRRVAVVTGRGNNGADGRAAARLLERGGRR